MKEIALLIYEDTVLSSIAGVLDLFAGTNRILQEAGAPPAFRVTLVSDKGNNPSMHIPGQFISNKNLSEVSNTDLVIAPAFYGDAQQALDKNHALVNWIITMHRRGAEVASLCLGSYFLAEAGLLAGRCCTTHWTAVDDMRRRYPNIDILPDLVVTDEEGIYTSGGAFSSLNLVLYLIEKFCGREVGIVASKMFSIDMDRVNQAHFSMFMGQHQHEDEEIRKAQSYIEEHFHLQISIEEIAERSNMSKRNFIRRFKHATQSTPLEYQQRVKIESAKKALEKSGDNISALMNNVGYNDLKTFRKVFKRITGLTPQDYRKKYCRSLN